MFSLPLFLKCKKSFVYDAGECIFNGQHGTIDWAKCLGGKKNVFKNCFAIFFHKACTLTYSVNVD